MEKLESIYQKLKIAPLAELTKKVLEEKLKLASELWDKSDDPFDSQIIRVYDQTVCLIYNLMENLRTQNHIHPAKQYIQDPVVNTQENLIKSAQVQKSQNGDMSSDSSDQVVTQRSTLKSNNANIPFWSKLDSNVKAINFIKIPPNLQSNKPLRRIKINQPLASEPKAGKFEKISSKASTVPKRVEIHSIYEIQFQFNVLSTWWPIKRNRLDELCRWLGYSIKILCKIN